MKSTTSGLRAQALAVALLLTLVLVPSAMAQSTRGIIEGNVKTDAGDSLVGVQVNLSSPNMQGTQTKVTDANGHFRFAALIPGVYKAEFSLDGYQAMSQEAIRVHIGSTRRMEVEMPATFQDTVVVTSERPAIDLGTTELGANLNADIFNELATTRDAFDIARVVPGAQADSCNPVSGQCQGSQSFYGSTGAENSYYIDGVNVTGIELGQRGKTLNFEFVAEVQVKTAGYGAEYGRAVGALINVITKSGGNSLKGDVFGYYDDIQNSLSGAAKTGPISGSRHIKEFTRQDFGIDLGGPFVKDRLWFFAAYNTVDNSDDIEVLKDTGIPGAPASGDIIKNQTDRELWAAKLTLSASPSHSFVAVGYGDPSETVGPGNRSLAASPLHWLGKDESGATDTALTYDGVFSDNVIASARVSLHEESYTVSGAGTETVGWLDLTNPLGDGTVVWGFEGFVGGFGFYQSQPELTRDQLNADISYFVDDFGGSHEFKIGYEFEDIGGINDNFNGGRGQRIYRFNCVDSATRDCRGSDYYYRHRFYTGDSTLDPETLTLGDVQVPLSVDIKTENDALYLQDSWRPTGNLTLNLGVRLETQALFNADGEVSGDFDDNLAHRLGVIFDPTGEGRARLFAHVGRFYETIPMDIVIRSFGGEISIFSYNLSPLEADVANDPTVRNARFLGGGLSPLDPTAKGEYLDELVIGAEMEIGKAVYGLKYISRDLKNVLEDALAADGDYFIGNPGRGLMKGTYDLGYAFGYNDTLHELPIPTREYTAIEFTLNKRLTDNFQFLASLIWSDLKGSYDGSYQISTGQLDPNLNSAFDYFDFSVNNDGKLSNNREWQAKFDGIYRFDFGLNVGVSAFYRTGTPITAMGYSDAYNNWEFYLSNRGAFGKVDGAYEADVHLGYPLPIGERLEVHLLLDIFNLLDAQTETLRDIRYTDGTEIYVPLDGFTGETSVLQPGDTAKPPTSTGFNTTNVWTNPRRFRLGVRLSF